MTGFIPEDDRNVIPRWRTFQETQYLPELHSSQSPPALSEPITNNRLERKIDDWKNNQTIGHASDLVGIALAEGQLHEVTDAIEFLLDDNEKAAPLAKQLANHAKHVLEGKQQTPPLLFNQNEFRNQVRTIRQLLHEEPNNPIQWVDLARAYANLGQYKQSSHCMDIAINLAPNNRFILRSASRLWIHTGQKDKAYHILIRSNRTPHDPWLLSAEIAVGMVAEKNPRFVKAAKKTLTSRKYLPVHISELASSVATIEWKYGAERIAKKFFRQSLNKPTENSIAQAVWISGRHKLLDLEDNQIQRADAHEAKARDFFFKEMWIQAVEECKRWQQVEPFSTRPARIGAYISSVILEDFSKAHTITKAALIANPNDPALLNSSAYALINLRYYDSAKEKLSKISNFESIQYQVYKNATTGLLYYRKGKIDEGKSKYNEAYSLAKKISKEFPSLPASVEAYHTLEKFRHLPPLEDQKFISNAIKSLEKHSDSNSKILIKKLNNLLDSHLQAA